jgi:acetamidase/formamidase
MLCVGDGHAAQGDGEVSGTAIECGMTSEIQFSLVADPPLGTIHATTPSGKITFGFSQSLNEAMTAALDAMVTWLTLLFEVDRHTALALASVAVSLRVTQVRTAPRIRLGRLRARRADAASAGINSSSRPERDRGPEPG